MKAKDLKDILANVSDEACIYFIDDEINEFLRVVDIFLTTSFVKDGKDNLHFSLTR